MPEETLPLFPESASREELVRICDDDLKDGDMRGVEFGDFGILLCKVEGAYRAIEDSCNHSGALLSGGRLENGVVSCPRHFLRFSVMNGELQTTPKICDPQKVYELRVKDGGVYIVKR